MNGTTWAEEKSPTVHHQPLIHVTQQPLNIEAHLKNGANTGFGKQLHVPVMAGCTNNAVSVSIETIEKPGGGLLCSQHQENHQQDIIKEPLCQNGSDHP